MNPEELAMAYAEENAPAKLDGVPLTGAFKVEILEIMRDAWIAGYRRMTS